MRGGVIEGESMAFGLETQLGCLPAVEDKPAPCPQFPHQETFVLVQCMVHENPWHRAWHPGGSRIDFSSLLPLAFSCSALQRPGQCT